MMPDDDQPQTPEDPPSRSARKRRALAAQALGRRLTALPASALTTLPLGDDLRHALAEFARLRKKEAIRRQMQYIGRLMRDEDLAAIEDKLDGMEHATAGDKRRHRDLERWRERLLSEPDALTDFVAAHPTVDVQQLRHLIARCHASRDDADTRTNGRRLYRYLSSIDPESES